METFTKKRMSKNTSTNTPSRATSKKGKGSKGGRKAIDKLLEEYASKYTPPPPEAFAEVEDKYVKLHLRLLMWQNLSFSLRVLESTNLYVIEQKIKERHDGTIKSLQLWKDALLPETKLTDYGKTLREVYQFDEMSPYSIKRRFQMLEKGNISQEDSSIIKEIDEINEMEGAGIHNLKAVDYNYECVMYYNFESFESNCPLLLREPQLVVVLNDEELKKKRRDTSSILPV